MEIEMQTRILFQAGDVTFLLQGCPLYKRSFELMPVP